MTKRKDIYISMDVEADGRVPGLSSMLSFAGAAFDSDKNLLGLFSRNLELLPAPAAPDADTDKFWHDNPVAYAETRKNVVLPSVAMPQFVAWVNGLPGKSTFVGYPAVYDFKWIDYYCHAFAGGNPFGFSRAVDVKSMAWPMLKTVSPSHCNKQRMPRRWFDPLPHTHVALDDAVEQGAMFVNMMREMRGLPAVAPLTAERLAEYKTEFAI